MTIKNKTQWPFDGYFKVALTRIFLNFIRLQKMNYFSSPNRADYF